MRVLVAIDGSAASEAAVAAVAERPWPAGTEIEVLSVVHTALPLLPDPAFFLAAARAERMHELRDRALECVGSAAESLRRAVPGATVVDTVLDGKPKDVILEEARGWDADLIVLASRGHGAGRSALLGSVSAAVAAQAPCSVEVVRPDDARRAAREDEERRRLQDHEEQLAFRGEIGDICSWEHPDMSPEERYRLCGDEQPIIDAHGRRIRRASNAH